MVVAPCSAACSRTSDVDLLADYCPRIGGHKNINAAPNCWLGETRRCRRVRIPTSGASRTGRTSRSYSSSGPCWSRCPHRTRWPCRPSGTHRSRRSCRTSSPGCTADSSWCDSARRSNRGPCCSVRSSGVVQNKTQRCRSIDLDHVVVTASSPSSCWATDVDFFPNICPTVVGDEHIDAAAHCRLCEARGAQRVRVLSCCTRRSGWPCSAHCTGWTGWTSSSHCTSWSRWTCRSRRTSRTSGTNSTRRPRRPCRS